MASRELALFVLAALLACKQKSDDAPAPSAAPAVAPAVAETKRFARADGTISAPKPAGDGWECVEQTAEGRGATDVRLIKCRRTAPGEFFFMLAKTYAVGKADVLSPEELAKGPFAKNYDGMFDTRRVKSEGSFERGGKSGYEVLFDAEHSSRGEIRKLERVLTDGTRVFILSAEGRPADYDRFQAERSAWLDGASFAELDEKKAQ